MTLPDNENDNNVASHKMYMGWAIKLAKYALDHGETPVACIFVHYKSKQIVAYGMNDTNNSLTGIAHAEFMAIEQIKSRFPNDPIGFNQFCSDCIVYVTVEPCIMCASALKQLNFKKIYFGCGNDRFGGNGTVLSINQDKSTVNYNGVVYKQKSIPGLYRREAIMLLRYFYVKENKRSPNPRIKLDRNLDKDNFPQINWSHYMNNNLFGQEFGLHNLSHFQTMDDIEEFSTIDWNLIDSTYDNILNDLQLETKHFKLNEYKRLKV
ncbi:tRNA-specific adenosine deaminase subunit Tad2p [Monosporozyma unispora]|nr:tRNA(adenine34) deaminase [Kazachstania unispora]